MRPLKTYLLKKRSYLLHALLLGAVLFLSSACVPMPGLDNEFEYNPSKKRELSELKNTYSLFSRMAEIDVALHISKRDFLSLINDSFGNFSDNFSSLDAGEFSNVRFGPMKFHMSNQQLVSQIEFSLQVDGLQREIYGHVMGTHRLDAGLNRFILTTDFDEIIVKNIDGTRVVDKKNENMKLIEKAAKSFMHTLNMEMRNAPLSIPVDLNILSGVNGKDIFSAPDYKLHSAKSVNMRTKMRMYLPYICKNGIIFLGSDRIKNSEELPEADMDLKKMSRSLRSKIDEGLQKSMGISLAVLQEESSCFVSKGYLSEQMSFSLKDMDLRTIKKFFLKIPEDEQNLSRTIQFSGKEHLPSCEGLAEDCIKAEQLCNRNCSMNYGRAKCTSCDSINNPFEKVRCMSDFEACKSKEELHLYECLKEEERCTLINTKYENQCRADNLSRIAQCEKKKESFVFRDDKVKLAELYLNLNVSNSYAIQRIHRIRFDKELSGLEVQRNLHVSVDTSLDFALIDTGMADVNCTLADKLPLFFHSFADRINRIRQVPVFTEPLSDGALLIKAQSQEETMPIKLQHSPYEKLGESEDILLSCSYQNMPLLQITADEILSKEEMEHLPKAILGEVQLAFEKEELSFRVSPVKIGKDLFLYPDMQEKSIVFNRHACFE